jgi:chromosomal replication initiator protein
MQHDSLWQAVLGEIELSVSRGNFVTWFKNTTLLKQEAGSITIGVANIFIKQTLEKKYTALFTETLQKNGVTVDLVEYKVVASAPRPAPADDPKHSNEQSKLGGPSHSNNNQVSFNSAPKDVLSHGYGQGLNERYTLDNFVVGDGNELAFAACQSIAGQPGTKYNPLFLYGGVGIGNTPYPGSRKRHCCPRPQPQDLIYFHGAICP